MQKIVLAGMLSNTQYTYASSFVQTLQELCYEVIQFNTRPKINLPIPKKVTTYLRDYLVNKNLIKMISKHKPDILFLIKAENIFASTLQLIKEKFGTTIINFYPDNPFAIWNGNSTINVLESLQIYDHFLIWSETLIPALNSAGSKQINYFPFAFDEKLFNHTVQITDEYISQVCFIGTWEPMREEMLTFLCTKLPEIDVAIWGNLWLEHIKPDHPLYKRIRGQAIYNDDMVAAIRGADIVLNFIRQQNATSHNMRTLEVPAAGGFILTERTYEQSKKLFVENESIACFSGHNELIDKIKYYLKNTDERKKISEKGSKISNEYTLKKQLSNFFKKQNIQEALLKKESHHERINS